MSIIKQFLIACLIIVSLFTAGAMNSRTMENLSDSISEQLSLSQSAAEGSRWEDVEGALSQASQTWKDHETYLHVMVDHKEIDEAESLFAEIRQYAAQRDSNKYCTGAERLSVQLDHLKESQRFDIKNIF